MANTFYDRFAAAADCFSARTAIQVQRRDGVDSFTYAELRRLAERTAPRLV
jgi:hypothetical protein